MARPARIALALGSGGARGYAHIGAIRVLEERGFEIVGIAGSSMGALVGGLHAAGKLEEYAEWSVGLSQFDVLRLLDVSLSAPGAIRAGKIFARVRQLLGDVRIEDLPVPVTIVATDLLSRREVWFQRGRLDVAIRASIAIPSVITPVVLNGRLLADGGLMNPVPVSPTPAVRADAVVAIGLHGAPAGTAAPETESAEPEPLEEWGERFRRGASRLLDNEVVRALTSRFGHVEATAGAEPADPDEPAPPAVPATTAEAAAAVAAEPTEPAEPAEGIEPVFGDLPAGLGKFDVMNLAIDAMQDVLTRYRLAGNPPDILVDVPKDACRSLDFHRAAELIELGRVLTTEAVDRAGW